jgi:hypothetical protein
MAGSLAEKTRHRGDRDADRAGPAGDPRREATETPGTEGYETSDEPQPGIRATGESGEAAGRTEPPRAPARARRTRPTSRGGSFFVGLVLVIVGLWFLLQNLGLDWLWWLDFGIVWPALLIVFGVLLLWRRIKEK